MNPSIKNVYIYLLLLTICYFSIYFRFFEFGLYEDDISRFNFFLKNHDQRLAALKSILNNFSMGRPLGIIFLNIFSAYLYDIIGLKGLYLFGLILFSLNSFLIYLILKNCFPIYLAIFAGIFFIAFPLDALKPTIVRTFIIQTSFLFSFLSCILFQRDHKIYSYVIFFLSLFIYEISIFIFIFIIFLEAKKLKLRNLIRHFLICFIIVLAALLIKKNFGNLGRASQLPDLGSLDGYLQIFKACIFGFNKSFNILLFRPIEIFKSFELWMVFPISIILCILFYFFLPSIELRKNNELQKNLKKKIYNNKDLIILLIFSLFFWLLSYSIMSGHRFGTINREFGRTTSTHLVSYFAITLSIISAFYLIEKFFVSKYIKNIIKTFLSIYLILNLSFNLVIQSKIIDNWKLSKQQFEFIDKNVKDWRDGLVISVPNLGNKWSYINSWANFLILKQMYIFSNVWKNIPVAITINKRNLILKNNKLHIKRAYNRDFEIIDDQNIIIIEYDKKNQKFNRKSGIHYIKFLEYELNLSKKEDMIIRKNKNFNIYTK